MSTHVSQRNVSDQELKSVLRDVASGAIPADTLFRWFEEEIRMGHYSSVLNEGTRRLNRYLSLDADAYEKIHKGTPFYWLGTAAFMVHDHQAAVFFYDAAVSEDLEAGHDPQTNPSPALYFIQIEGDKLKQAARDLVKVAQERVEDVIAEYNNMSGRPKNVQDLTIADLRASFLRPAVLPGSETWRTLATALISFFLEWDYRNLMLDLRAGAGTAEPFFIHLLKGCVLFESLLKAYPNCQISANVALQRALRSLHTQLGIAPDFRIGNSHFLTILHDLQDADYSSIQTALQFAGRIRNSIAHSLSWQVSLNKIQYHRLFRMVATSCLHAIACLY